MDKKLFDQLLASTQEASEIIAGRQAPSRAFQVDALAVRQIRESTGLSQARFAQLIHISVGTLRNWEQGRRRPDGPAAALLMAIRNDPDHVIAALNR